MYEVSKLLYLEECRILFLEISRPEAFLPVRHTICDDVRIFIRVRSGNNDAARCGSCLA
jgi:hypothetical protein